MISNHFFVGQLVKYSTPENEQEQQARFTVLEITPADGKIGEKLTVELVCNMAIKPTNCFFSKEFTAA